MKRINIFLIVFLAVVSVNAQNVQGQKSTDPAIGDKMSSFGEEIDQKGSIAAKEMLMKYTNLAVADTLSAKFTATITDVCQAKGCWMKLQLEDGKDAMVRFKDYGFFMPKNSIGKEVVVNGLAFVEEMSVDDQKHYAKDGGKSEDEIAKINTPKKTYGFEANGVLLKE